MNITEITQTNAYGPVYHGTNEKFDNFDLSKVGSNFNFDATGIFFTSDPAIAKTYGNNIISAIVTISNPFTLDDALDQLGYSYEEEYEENGVTLTEYYDTYTSRIISAAKRLGKDGIVFEDFGEQLVIAFSPSQIQIIK